MAAGETEAATKVLEDAMNLPGVKQVGSGPAANSQSMVTLTLDDRASIFTTLVQLYTKQKRLDDASGIIQHAIAEFAGTSEEVKILVANSQLAIEKGEIDQAIHMLKSMKSSNPQYAVATAAMADIYLKHRKDKKAYARCYKPLLIISRRSRII
jgi:tetratricopeptide repeat protein 21B